MPQPHDEDPGGCDSALYPRRGIAEYAWNLLLDLKDHGKPSRPLTGSVDNRALPWFGLWLGVGVRHLPCRT
jgi:hypothetical protein